MVNHCITIGLTNDISSMKRLSKLSYEQTGEYNIVNYYRLCAISHAAGILANRRKSIKRGYETRDPYVKKPLLISCYGLKIDHDKGVFRVPLGKRQYSEINLNKHVRTILKDPTIRVRSFLISENGVSICYSKVVEQSIPTDVLGIDSNLSNITVGNLKDVVMYDVTKVVQIADNSRSVMRALKRNDVRIRKRLACYETRPTPEGSYQSIIAQGFKGYSTTG